MLSNKTSPRTARQVFVRLRAELGSWDALLGTPLSKIERTIRPAGLSKKRSMQLVGAFKILKRLYGRVTLAPLRKLKDDEVLRNLTSLPGVSEKVAKCVMMYTMGRNVFPVDTHAFRVCKRLGWTRKNRPDLAGEQLEELIPPNLRYGLHVALVVHGRDVCRPVGPVCRRCSIERWCPRRGVGRG